MARLTDEKGKTVTLVIETENEQLENNVSTHPIETGSPLTDHAQMVSKTIDFSGKIKGNSLSEVNNKYSQLLAWFHGANMLTFRGAIWQNNLIISHLEKTYDEGGLKNAVKFNMTLTVVYSIDLKWQRAKQSGKKQTTKKSKTSSRKSKAVYVTVRSGNTYWGWSQRYGTSISQLRKWNKWPDRFIPIGKRARVK